MLSKAAAHWLLYHHKQGSGCFSYTGIGCLNRAKLYFLIITHMGNNRSQPQSDTSIHIFKKLFVHLSLSVCPLDAINIGEGRCMWLEAIILKANATTNKFYKRPKTETNSSKRLLFKTHYAASYWPYIRVMEGNLLLAMMYRWQINTTYVRIGLDDIFWEMIYTCQSLIQQW